MTDNSPQLGGQSDVTGREPELSGARPIAADPGSTMVNALNLLGISAQAMVVAFGAAASAFTPELVDLVRAEAERRSNE